MREKLQKLQLFPNCGLRQTFPKTEKHMTNANQNKTNCKKKSNLSNETLKECET